MKNLINVKHYDKNFEYLQSRLGNTVIRDKWGQPIYIRSISGKGKADVYYLLSGKTNILPVEDLDVSPPSLGYVNYHKICSYCQRKPHRYYKQGLSASNLAFNNKSCSIDSVYLGKTIINIYPSVDECAELIVNGEADSRSFSRDYALENHTPSIKKNLIPFVYRDKKVGVYNFQDGVNKLELDDKFKFLKEDLEEALANG